jgi:Mrp family chromosome partitioning ATPase
MSKLVDQLEQKWEMVLFDSPPIVAVTDASMISGEIDAVAMVIKAGQTEKAAVERAIDTISNVKAPLIGVILNGASQQSLGGKYSYYYSYYQYYYADEQGQKKRRKSSSSKV